MEQPSRQPVYDALDKFPIAIFAAVVSCMIGVNKVIGLTFLEDPTPCAELDRAIKPFMSMLTGEGG